MFQLTEEYCRQVRDSAYIGQKGYTLLKNQLHLHDLEQIKKDLFKIPVINGKPQKELGFPIYRENENKLYVPRFYATGRYRGMPKSSNISCGETLNCEFQGSLLPHQIEAIDKYKACIASGSAGGILELPCGYGKCLAKGTPILMFDGSIRPVETILTGDLLMGDDSKPRRVLSTSVGTGPLYKVTGGGQSYIGNADHILSLCRFNELGERIVLDISIQEYLYKFSNGEEGDDASVWMGYRVPIEFIERPVKFSPYWMGYGCIDLKKTEILQEYFINSRRIRLEFLGGLIDSVGNLEKIPSFLAFLLHSLGIDFIKENESESESKLIIPMENLPEDLMPFIKSGFLTTAKTKTTRRQQGTYPIQITQDNPTGKYYGFEIDGNRRFLLSDFTVTHNTVLSISLIADLRKKTIILVHKEFLMNQWIERIRQFLPSARVGILQGKFREVENVDICIGMIQSIYNKDFPVETFSPFGLTIIDEVHRIGSAEFSGVLMRIVTPWMLGISATVDRKDKLTDILYSFIGPKIHSVKRREDDLVQVRAIEFMTSDESFKTVETDYRGQVKYSTMISKLCAYAPRSDFIVRVIIDQYREHAKKQMIVLCHNRCLLVYLHDVLVKVGGGLTVGYYVGGMKQAQLEASESKNVVLATYAMASEALDIKSLSTLLLITPKTDIVQSVGRILRTKHNSPLIIDIVDCHPCFQNQWNKRRLYYKQCKYDIWKTTSRAYPLDLKKLTNGGDSDEPGMASREIDESIFLMDVGDV